MDENTNNGFVPSEPEEEGYTVQNPTSYYNYSAPSELQEEAVQPQPYRARKSGLVIALITISSFLAVVLVAACILLVVVLNGNGAVSSSKNSEDKQSSSGKGETSSVVDDSINQNEEEKKPSIETQNKEDAQWMNIENVVQKTLPQVVGVVATSGQGFYEGESQGSGIIFSEDGYIITNAHVIQDATKLRIVLPDENKTTYDAKVIGSDSKTDLAVLKADVGDDKLPAADLGNSDELNLGETVVTIGNPYGLELQSSVTSGIVSALNRSITTSNGKMNLIQTDAAINPGNSGGALVNLYGQVVGICSSKISDTDAEGLGFAIPINDAIPIIEELIDNGFIGGRPMIGIQGEDVTAQTAMMYGVPTGVLVVSVDEGSSAYKEGLREGDIITEFNGTVVSCFSDLDIAKDECKAGDSVDIRYFRYDYRTGGKYYTAHITLSESSATE